MNIEFPDTHYAKSDDKPLKARLETFFNRDDVQEKLGAVARHIFPQGLDTSPFPKAYGLVTVGLAVFGVSPETDGDPHNLCGAVIHAAANAKNDATMDRSVRAGLDSCAKQMLSIVEADVSKGALKSDILAAAKNAKLTYDKGVV